MTTVKPASDETGPVRVRIGDDEYEINRPTESQLLGVLMLAESGLPELEQAQLMLRLTTSLLPIGARAAFIGKFIDGGYGLRDLEATFKAMTGIEVEAKIVDGPQAAPRKTARKTAQRKATARK